MVLEKELYKYCIIIIIINNNNNNNNLKTRTANFKYCNYFLSNKFLSLVPCITLLNIY